MRQPPLSDEESQFESAQRMAGVVLKLVLVAIPLVITILYFTLRSRSSAPPAEPPPRGAAPSTPASAPAAPVAQPDVARPSSPADVPVTPPALSTLAKAQPPQTAPEASADTTALELHPTGSCWVSVTVDGRRVLARVMEPGERQRFTVKTEAVVEVGDAGAFAYSINGKEGPPLGAAGQVKTLRVTAPSAPR